MRGIDGLRESLETLLLSIDNVRVVTRYVTLAGYPDGPRPSSTVMLCGGGVTGCGEHVGWTDLAHEEFRSAAGSIPSGSWQLGDWVSMLDDLPPYDRAALEAAAIDLALRQKGLSLFDLADVPPSPVRYVLSFAPLCDPVAEAKSLAPCGIELKIDADPAWSDDIWQELASTGRIAVVDFKLRGKPDDHERACRFLPGAWIEDAQPDAGCSGALLARASADAAVTSVDALEALSPQPAAVNVKSARMGSVLEAIACLAHARARGIETYVGGMFEVGVGRSQSLVLAALACPDGPNDIAPLTGPPPGGMRLVVDARAPGFGAEALQ